ncbi:MAG: hypothetical protein ACO3G9_09405, partial [Chthoniobacterales bacterium]
MRTSTAQANGLVDTQEEKLPQHRKAETQVDPRWAASRAARLPRNTDDFATGKLLPGKRSYLRLDGKYCIFRAMLVGEQVDRSRGNDKISNVIGFEDKDAHRQHSPRPASGDWPGAMASRKRFSSVVCT